MRTYISFACLMSTRQILVLFDSTGCNLSCVADITAFIAAERCNEGGESCACSGGNKWPAAGRQL